MMGIMTINSAPERDDLFAYVYNAGGKQRIEYESGNKGKDRHCDIPYRCSEVRKEFSLEDRVHIMPP